MKEKIEGLWLTIKDFVQDGIWWVQDNVKSALYLVGIVVVGFLVYAILQSDKSSGYSSKVENLEPNSEEQLAFMKDSSESLKEVLSELQVINVGVDPRYPMLDIDLYLKKPFISSRDLEDALNLYLDLLKLKYNDDNDKKYLSGVRINIYDRKVVFEKRLRPNGTYTYMLHKNNVEESDDKFDRVINISQAAWELTMDRKKKPNYRDYQVQFEFNELTRNPSISPLSDEEFEWYLKYKVYQAMAGNSNPGSRLYMQWELGANTTRDGFYLVTKSFEKFEDRLKGINAVTDYYTTKDDLYSLKQELAISNPQFLLYVETREIEEDPMEARRKLILYDSSNYTRIIENWIDRQSSEFPEIVDPASPQLDKNKTNSQLLESEVISTQEENILENSIDAN